MMPILYQCNLFTIYTYGVFVAVAFLISTFLLMKEARRKHFDENFIYNLCIVLLIGGIISARLFYVGLNWDYFKKNPVEIMMLQHGGLVWFGGLIGSFLWGIIFIKIKKRALLPVLDLLAPYAALAQSIGRIGCFFNGCCYGRESAWGIYFPVHGLTLFPSQIVDSLTLLVIFVILRLIQEKTKDGAIFSFYILLASTQRFLMEFIRGDLRPFYHGLSIFQWISIALFFCGFTFTLILLCKKKAV